MPVVGRGHCRLSFHDQVRRHREPTWPPSHTPSFKKRQTAPKSRAGRHGGGFMPVSPRTRLDRGTWHRRHTPRQRARRQIQFLEILARVPGVQAQDRSEPSLLSTQPSATRRPVRRLLRWLLFRCSGAVSSGSGHSRGRGNGDRKAPAGSTRCARNRCTRNGCTRNAPACACDPAAFQDVGHAVINQQPQVHTLNKGT